MDSIPESGFLRLPQVLSVIPLGKTSWWEGVRIGPFSEAGEVIGPMHGLAGRRYSRVDQESV